MNDRKPPTHHAVIDPLHKVDGKVVSADERTGAVLCSKCNAIVAAWRVGENGGACHVCGDQIDAKGTP